MNLTLVPLPAHRVALAAGEVVFHDVGSPDARACAVFVPGYTGSKEDFGQIAGPVAEAGYRYVALDQRGQYESVGPDDPAAYTTEALAIELVEFLRSLGGAPAHVVGHSFGGIVARAAAIKAPEAFASLVLMDSGPAGLTGPRVEAMRALAPVLDELGPDALFDRLVGREPGTPDDDLTAFLRRRFLASSVTALRTMGEAVTEEPDRTEELRATGVRIAVLCGEHDDAWPPAVQRDMAERLGAPYLEVPGAVHSPAAEQPAETARLLLEFWG